MGCRDFAAVKKTGKNGEVTEATEETLAFALGMILYYMLTYTLPYDGLDGVTSGTRIVQEKPPTLDALSTSAFLKLLNACLEKDKAKRPNLQQLKGDFLSVLPEGSKPVAKTETAKFEPLSSTVESHETGDGEEE